MDEADYEMLTEWARQFPSFTFKTMRQHFHEIGVTHWEAARYLERWRAEKLVTIKNFTEYHWRENGTTSNRQTD
jgi:hypothetical protein